MSRLSPPQVFGSVIEAAAVAGKPSVAAEVLRRMRLAGVEPNVIAYTSLLSRRVGGGTARCGGLKACSALAHVQCCGRVPPGALFRANPASPCLSALHHAAPCTHTPQLARLPCLSRSYSATGDLEGAKRVLQDMAAAGCPPNVKTYTELMSQLAAKGECWLGSDGFGG